MRAIDFRLRPPLGGCLDTVMYADTDRTYPLPPCRYAIDTLPGYSNRGSMIERIFYRNAAALPGTAA
jgi:hypothetical protein